jgi:hypothetical protein
MNFVLKRYILGMGILATSLGVGIFLYSHHGASSLVANSLLDNISPATRSTSSRVIPENTTEVAEDQSKPLAIIKSDAIGGIAHVTLLEDAQTPLVPNADNPNSFSWDTTKETNGSHALRAGASSTSGLSATSLTWVNVSN